MAAAPEPPNEAERLRTLRLYRILDSGSEAAFDQFTLLASAICEAPISLISLIDEDRQWFKSRVGLQVSETDRSAAFCAHAILHDEVLVVEDATKDRRFADNPLVLSDPSIRFYAGAPLTVSSGVSLGALCVIDRVPRQRTLRQTEALSVLRRAVVTQLELRRALEDLRVVEQILSMCSWCRHVRNADDTWSALDEYVTEAVSVSHGLCPTCEGYLEKAA